MKERIALFDNIKFILITLVVIGHLCDEFTDKSGIYKSIFLFIYTFHMPLFIFISGLFHNEKNILKKCIFYISIGFLYKIITLIVDILYGSENLSFSFLSDGGISWFMFVLAIYTILVYIIRNENKKYILFSSIMLALFIGYDQSIGDFLYISRTVIFFPFYLLATMFKPNDIVHFKRKYKCFYIFSAFIFVSWFLLCFFKINTVYGLRYLFTGRNAFFEPILKSGPIFRLFCYIISSLLCISVIFLTPNKKIIGLTSMGKNSINVYFWHFKLYIFFEKLFSISALFYMGKVGKIGFLFIGVIITVILSQDFIFTFPIKQIKRTIFFNS